MQLGLPHSWANAIGNALGTGLVPVVTGVAMALFLIAVTLSDMAAIPKPVWRSAFGRNPGLERWDVRPKSGHVDIAMLNLDTGAVICP